MQQNLIAIDLFIPLPPLYRYFNLIRDIVQLNLVNAPGPEQAGLPEPRARGG
jgi:hypothetical protein